MKKKYLMYAGMAMLVETLMFGCGAINTDSLDSNMGVEMKQTQGTEGNANLENNDTESNAEEETESNMELSHNHESDSENQGCELCAEAKKRMVKIHGKLYKETGEIDTKVTCGTLDGNITSYVDEGTFPMENDQANFPEAKGYQLGGRENRIVIPMEDGWHIFAFNENSLMGLEMRMKEANKSTGTVEFINNTGIEVDYGEDFSLEVLDPEVNEWRNMPITNEDNWGFHDIAYILKSGESAECVVNYAWLYGTLEKGTYRVVKTVFAQYDDPYYDLNHIWEDRKFTYTCMFEIEE